MSGKTDGALLIMALIPFVCGASGCSQANIANSYNEKAKTIVVRANMKAVQNAAEKYSKDHIYLYPTKIDDEFKYYFSGGDPTAKKVGQAPTNPFTGTAEWPVLGNVSDLSVSRSAAPEALAAGTIEYSPLNNGKSYAIRGGGEDGKAIASDNAAAAGTGTMVLSRDNYEKPASP